MSDHFIVANTDSFDKDVLKSELPVVVYFYSEDCLPCRNFSQIFDRTAAMLSEHMRFVKIFRPHNRPLADQYKIKSSPTVLFFKEGKEVCVRLTGYIHHPEFRASIENVLEKHCPSETKNIVHCDVLIIGAGPAGLTAGIYTARSRLYTVILDSSLPGGQVATTYHIANYPGTNGVIRGIDLMDNMKNQALSFGVQIDDLQQIKELYLEGDQKHVKTDTHEYYAKSVIIATGSEPKKLPVEKERDFRGRGIHYCATCDGALYQETDVLVVGGGTSAVEEAVFLSRYARSIKIIHRSDQFKAAKSSVEDALKNSSISVLYNTVIKEVKGEHFIQSVVLEDTKTGESKELPIDGIFVYIGTQPNSSLFKDLLKTTDNGYIITDQNMQTSVSGVYAAGDIRDKEIRQISTAVGDGTIAGIMAERHINRRP